MTIRYACAFDIINTWQEVQLDEFGAPLLDEDGNYVFTNFSSTTSYPNGVRDLAPETIGSGWVAVWGYEDATAENALYCQSIAQDPSITTEQDAWAALLLLPAFADATLLP